MVIGILAGISFFGAGGMMFTASTQLQTLRSVDGHTVAEAYYQGVGAQGIGFSVAFFALGLASIAISIGLGNLLDAPFQPQEELQESGSLFQVASKGPN